MLLVEKIKIQASPKYKSGLCNDIDKDTSPRDHSSEICSINGKCTMKQLLKICQENPDSIMDVFKKAKALEKCLPDVEFDSDIKTNCKGNGTDKNSKPQNKYHFLMVDNSTSLNIFQQEQTKSEVEGKVALVLESSKKILSAAGNENRKNGRGDPGSTITEKKIVSYEVEPAETKMNYDSSSRDSFPPDGVDSDGVDSEGEWTKGRSTNSIDCEATTTKRKQSQSLKNRPSRSKELKEKVRTPAAPASTKENWTYDKRETHKSRQQVTGSRVYAGIDESTTRTPLVHPFSWHPESNTSLIGNTPSSLLNFFLEEQMDQSHNELLAKDSRKRKSWRFFRYFGKKGAPNKDPEITSEDDEDNESYCKR
ncbi:hypothetical protein JTB14_024617 [Gonioctena quinquepunctata]|nr:hypothetical protein JTB14_024617 [Gonioctena quinquepunctata]